MTEDELHALTQAFIALDRSPQTRSFATIIGAIITRERGGYCRVGDCTCASQLGYRACVSSGSPIQDRLPMEYRVRHASGCACMRNSEKSCDCDRDELIDRLASRSSHSGSDTSVCGDPGCVCAPYAPVGTRFHRPSFRASSTPSLGHEQK